MRRCDWVDPKTGERCAKAGGPRPYLRGNYCQRCTARAFHAQKKAKRSTPRVAAGA